MTNKQIMIDDVDVSGCVYFKMNNKMPMCRACNSGVGSPYCEYHKDCYYKQLDQLKRKEQKLDKIKTICEKETTKSTFCNGIENKDSQKLAIKILKIIIGGK